MELQSIGQIPIQCYQYIDTSIHCFDKTSGSFINFRDPLLSAFRGLVSEIPATMNDILCLLFWCLTHGPHGCSGNSLLTP